MSVSLPSILTVVADGTPARFDTGLSLISPQKPPTRTIVASTGFRAETGP